MKLVINRFLDNRLQTLGIMNVINASGVLVFACKTLEPAWLNNQNKVSCIPAGTYKVVKRTSPKYGAHFHITNVPGRTWVLIHFGNYRRDTLGCVLPGKEFSDIDGDGLRDVTNSKATMKKLLELMPDSFELTITPTKCAI